MSFYVFCCREMACLFQNNFPNETNSNIKAFGLIGTECIKNKIKTAKPEVLNGT